MNGKQLKNSILQWAIQGKLVPQDPNDEPASVLLERIREEKARLVKEKKIKKDKNESIIYRGEDNSYYEKFLATGEVKCIDEEIPFEIPQGWSVCRLNDLALYRKGPFGSSLTKSMFVPKSDTSIKVYEQKNAIQKNYELGEYYISKEKYKMMQSFIVEPSDIIVSYAGTIGETYQLPSTAPIGIINQALMRVRPYNLEMSEYWEMYFRYILLNEAEMKGAGSAIKNIPPFEYLRAIIVAVPPITEQRKIINRYYQVSTLLDRFDKLQKELNSLNNEIIPSIKKSILQEAIQGKLVPQMAEEGATKELLEQIRKEKLKLVKEGKLKKSVLTDSIIFKGDDNKYYERLNGQIVEVELPFEYPNSWVVLRLKDICQLIDGEKRCGKGICLDAKYLRGKSSATIVNRGKFVYAGNNIILVDGENSGEVFSVPQDGYMGSTFKQLWLSSVMWNPYILAFILFYKEELRNSKRGAAIPHLNKDLFYNLPIGIPPLEEQKRIAKRIEQLFQLLK